MSRYHHGRQDVSPEAKPGRAAQAETDAPQAMIERLQKRVFAIFYAGQDGRRWLQDQKPLVMALTWPAVWLNDRGVGMPVAEYEAKMTEILDTVASHGNVAKIRLIPAYLADCVRKHFIHHGEEIYEARKHVRNALDLAALVGRPAPAAIADAVPSLVQAHAVLATAKTRAKKVVKDDSQGSLF